MAAKSWYVFSTASNGIEFVKWRPRNNSKAEAPNIPEASVVIKGGANVVDKKHLITPMGVMTTVSDAEMDFLKEQRLFQNMQKTGRLKVLRKPENADKVARDMDPKDHSAPLTPKDYRANKEPKVQPYKHEF